MSNERSDNSLHKSLRAIVRDMLAELGRPSDCEFTPIPGGRNNRVYRVDTPDGPLLLKEYYHAEDDTRNRLAAEFDFSRFAWSRGLRCIPEPLARRDDRHVALLEWIDGMRPSDPKNDHIESAIDFLLKLNTNGDSDAAQPIPNAAEACFSITEHVECIEARIVRLSRIKPNDDVDESALRFVEEELRPDLDDITSSLRQNSRFHATVNECWISPSDFGFHNALLSSEDELRFFDFEYAGWDDPAKTVCDFFFQPQVPVPVKYRPQFMDAICDASNDGDAIRERVALLWPLYRIKWCGIMMNEFLPQGARRRAFGGGAITADDKRRQLAAAKACFERDDAP